MSTKLRLEYCELSRDFDFPDDLEDALENDYVENNKYYSINTMRCIKMRQVLGVVTPSEIIELVKIWYEIKVDG